jgi:hypothetical protein
MQTVSTYVSSHPLSLDRWSGTYVVARWLVEDDCPRKSAALDCKSGKPA